MVTTARSWLALLWSIPIGWAGGMLGLGGAEFRLPVLAGLLGLGTKLAVPLNLAISGVTIATALVVRWYGGFAPPQGSLGVLLGLAAGGVVGAFLGTALSERVRERELDRLVTTLLVAIGVLLLVESVIPDGLPALLPERTTVSVLIAGVLGVAIGVVSSLLGVAGGELLIPTLLFVFGFGIAEAGTASLAVSVPTVATGLIRYARGGRYDLATLRAIGVPMAAGSVAGGVLGAAMLGLVPAALLKAGLGLVLIISAWRIFGSSR